MLFGSFMPLILQHHEHRTGSICEFLKFMSQLLVDFLEVEITNKTHHKFRKYSIECKECDMTKDNWEGMNLSFMLRGLV